MPHSTTSTGAPDRLVSEEIEKRLGEVGPGLLMMPRLVAVQDFHKTQRAHRRRVDHGYNAMAKQLGIEPLPSDEQGEGDEMGDTFTITGDQIHHHYESGEATAPVPAPAPAPAPVPTTPVPAPTNPVAPPATDTQNNTLRNLALAAALLTGGAGAGYGLHWLLNRPADTPTFTDSDTDTNTMIEGGTPYIPAQP